jgi:hypothetical protein
MNEYNPTNTAAAKCPDTNTNWGAMASPLPPAANAEACSCMMGTLGCQVNTDELEEDDYGKLFGTVCGYEDGQYCAGINRNTTKGPYGAWSMCSPMEQLSFALDQYAQKNTDGCDFRGQAKTKTVSSNSPSSCKAIIEQAGAQGTGTLTASPNNGGSTTPSKGAAAGLTAPRLDSGILGFGVYVGAAVLSGMALILF